MESNWGRALAKARGRVGLSQEAAGEAVGLNRVLLSNYETGRRQPSLPTLAALARLYGLPLSAMLQEVEEPAESLPSSEILFRAAPHLLGERAKVGMRQFSDLVQAYLEFLEDLGGEAPGRQASPLPRARVRASRQDAARLARSVRELLHLGTGPIDGLFRLVDEHVLVFRLFLGDLEAAPSGLFYNHPRAGFCIVVNSDMTLGRQVFTLAHELAHAFFHSQEADTWISMPGASLDKERFADAFAAELLVPGDALAHVIEELEAWEELSDPVVVVHLQRHFGVSYAALLVRLLQEGLVSQKQYEALGRISPSTFARRLGYPVNPADLGDYELPPLDRFPDRMLRLVRVAILRKHVTPGDAAETFGVSVEDVRLLLDPPRAGRTERQVLRDLEKAAHLG